jgi:hypothetical protein
LSDASEATVSHRDLPALFRELATLLDQVVCVDSLALFLHDDAGRTCLAALHRRRAEFIAADRLMKDMSRADRHVGHVSQADCDGGDHLRRAPWA